jgi:acetyl esterase/lipase
MASPLRYSQTAVPTIFWYGSADLTTPLAQTFELYKRLRQRQIRSQLMDLPGAPHSLVELSPQSRDTVFRQLLGFLNSVFYHPTPWGG